MDDRKFFNPQKNPSFKDHETVLLLAEKDGKVLGRIMVLIPQAFNEMHQVQTARFAYFETYPDKTIFDALLQYAETWAKKRGCNQMIGPMGFSDKEPQGFLTSGFDEPTMMVTNCSLPFMKDFIQENQYQSFVELCQYDVSIKEEIVDTYRKFAERILKNKHFQVREFTKTKEITPYVQSVFRLINSTYTKIYGFTKVTEEEAEDFAKRFIPLLNPRLIKLITDDQNEVIAFVIAMPDLSDAIKKAKGRLFPLGWLYILSAMKTSKRLVLLLGAVKNEYQDRGLDAVLAIHLIESATQLGFQIMDSHLIMKENTKMRKVIERIENHRLYKEYTIYSKDI